MKMMTKTMRWFGESDPTSLTNLRQCGISGIVTSLHHIPTGEIWTVEEISKTKQVIEQQGLEWKVVESLPVHEDIKKGEGSYLEYIENYIISLQNLAKCGLEVITYNFMPVLDWMRTHHKFKNLDQTETLYFNKLAFIYFDIALLQRPNAEKDYSDEIINKAFIYGNNLNEVEKQNLFRSCAIALPGSTTDFSKEEILTLLKEYQHVDTITLKRNLIFFLHKVAPIADSLGLKLAIHPDDPPFPLLGLPRIVSTQSDLEYIINALPIEANGLCYCTGSLGALPSNNLLNILDSLSNRVHFLHLRNVDVDIEGNFKESDHLDGHVPMVEVISKILQIMNTRDISLPMRPDHGFLHDIEKDKKHYPGYSMVGRMKGLAEISGLERGLAHSYDLTGYQTLMTDQHKTQ